MYGTDNAVMLLLMLLAGLVATTASLARYQIGISRSVDLLKTSSVFGIALTLLSDVLIATGVLYAACLWGASRQNLGELLFIRVVIPVVAMKVISMAIFRCYPRLTQMHFQRTIRLWVANVFGAILLLALIPSFLPDSGPYIVVMDLVLCPTLIIVLRAYHRMLERQCLAPLRIAEGSHD